VDGQGGSGGYLKQNAGSWTRRDLYR
jgi:hypothetical protein